MHGEPEKLKWIPVFGFLSSKIAEEHLEHHKEVDMDMRLNNISNEKALFFDWYITFLLFVLFFTTMFTIYRPKKMKNLMYLFIYSFSIVSFESFLWNNIHNDMHASNITIRLYDGIPNTPGLLSKGPIYRYLWRNHAIHHLQKDNKGNFNIIFPGTDHIFGTKHYSCFDNTTYCEKNKKDGRVCGKVSNIKRQITDYDVLPK
jgi:hypothetical protein